MPWVHGYIHTYVRMYILVCICGHIYVRMWMYIRTCEDLVCVMIVVLLRQCQTDY